MASLEQLHEMLAFVLEKEARISKRRSLVVAAHFASLDEFALFDPSRYEFRSVSGIQFLTLRRGEAEALRELQHSGLVNPALSVQENYVAALARDFTRRQIESIKSMTLDRLSPNPFLIRSLMLVTPRELVALNVYMLATRSIVTSMGYLVEKLLQSSSDTVSKPPKGTGWDLVKVKDGRRHWIQSKSGPNDMDKDQVIYWASKIQEKVGEGDFGYIGVTYGKRTTPSISIGLMRQYLPKWQMRTLIGRELWDFIGDDPDYHNKLFAALHTAAQQVLGTNTFGAEIEGGIGRITEEFVRRYGDGPAGVQRYVDEIF